MPSFEIHAPDYPTLVAAAKAIGIWRDDDPNIPGDQSGFVTGGVAQDGTGWALNAYLTRYAPTGRTIPDRMGNPQPEMAPMPGVYAALNWNGPVEDMPKVPDGSGVTIIPLPADSPVVFA